MKISRQNILEINKGEFPLEMHRGREQNATVCSGQQERTGLGRIGDVEIRYQVRSICEFGCRDPFRFISSVFIPQPDHLIQEFTCPLAIDFRVHYLRNFIFRFPINYDWSRGWLYSFGESVECGGFKYGHMEDWMNRAHRLWKTESERQSARLRDDFVGSKIFFGEFL